MDLIDFGAGTGENTLYLANWGAKCTLVEMNIKAQDISKKVFKDYALNPNDHKFVLSSIFDYQPNDNKKYDIVHCCGRQHSKRPKPHPPNFVGSRPK